MDRFVRGTASSVDSAGATKSDKIYCYNMGKTREPILSKTFGSYACIELFNVISCLDGSSILPTSTKVFVSKFFEASFSETLMKLGGGGNTNRYIPTLMKRPT